MHRLINFYMEKCHCNSLTPYPDSHIYLFQIAISRGATHAENVRPHKEGTAKPLPSLEHISSQNPYPL